MKLARPGNFTAVKRLHRFAGFDIARSLAVVMMYIAHTAPTDGPARIFKVADFLTTPIFAMMLGCGIALSFERTRFPTWAWLGSQWLRAGILYLLGLALAQVYWGILVVLMHQALVQLVVPLFVALPSWARSLSSLIFAVGSVVATKVSQANEPVTFPVTPADPSLADILGQGPYFPLAFVAYGLTGTVLATWYLRHREQPQTSRTLFLSTLVGLVVMLGLLVVPNLIGFPVHADEGTAMETAGNLIGAAAVGTGSLWLARRLPHRASTIRLLLVALGRCTLTLYCLQSLLLRVWYETTGNSQFSWLVLTGLTVISFALACTWQALFRRVSLPWVLGAFRYGPVEGLSGCLTRGALQLVAGRTTA